MDSSYCIILLVWIPWIIILHLCQDVSASGRRCAQGLIEHDNVPRVGQFVCCKPVRCGVGKEVVKCTINGTEDKCQSCGDQYNQSLRTSSYTLERCSPWPLDENCRHKGGLDKGSLEPVTWETMRCMCNIELGWRYEKPLYSYDGLPNVAYCQTMKAQCHPGYEPDLTGSCKPCKDHYFKNGTNYHLCEPKVNCTMLGLNVEKFSGPTDDDKCSEPDPVTSPTPVITEKPSPASNSPKPPTSPDLETTTPVITTSTSSDSFYAPSKASGSSSSDDVVGPIIGSVAFVIIVILIIFAVIFCKSRRRRIFCCSECAKKCAEPGIDLHSFSQREHCSKNVCGNGNIPPHLGGGDKTNNNISNPQLYVPIQQSQHVTVDSFYPALQAQSQYPPYTSAAATTEPQVRRGILRNVVAAQSRNNHSESIDSIGPEKALISLDRLEANTDLGENDPLLVQHPHGAVAYQNPASSPCHSPPIFQAGRNPIMNPIYSYAKNPAVSPHLLHNGHVSPAINVPTPAFTRSTSVIASPEGEVDEDAIDARVPRFSQLLPDGDQSLSVAAVLNPVPAEREQIKTVSAGLVTNQIRVPSQRVNQQQPVTTATQQPLKRPHHRQGLHAGPLASAQENLPDHCIMNLKEQQLAESLHSSEGSSSLSFLNEVQDLGFRAVRHSPETQQTEVKTESPLAGHETFINSPRQDPLLPKAVLPENTLTPNLAFPIVEKNQCACDNGVNAHEKRPVNEGVSSDRRCVPSGGNVGSSGSSPAVWPPPTPGNDPHKSCIKIAEEVNTGSRKQRYNRTVSFEEDENAQVNHRHRGNTTAFDNQQRHHVVIDAEGSNDVRLRSPNCNLSDSEQKTDVDDEETERKCVSLEFNNSSTGSSKTSVNLEMGGSDSNTGSPSRSALYRRSQSENAHSSTESTHKPPPRSMSEEKPQKADRPIAKVKPMPASDSTINQLATDAVDGSDVQAQIPVTALDTNSSTSSTNALSYSSEDSEHEESDSEEITNH